MICGLHSEKTPCVMYALESMGDWRRQDSLSWSSFSSLSNSWTSQKLYRSSLCVSTWSCRTPSSAYAHKRMGVPMKYCVAERRFICFHVTLPWVVFVLRLDFRLFIQSPNMNIRHAPGASSNDDLKRNEVLHFFSDNCIKE